MTLKTIIPFSIISLVSFLYENVYLKNCNKNLYTYLISLLHHVGSMYIVFGSLFFKNYLFHIIIVILTVSLWQVFDNRCILTLYYNKLCELPEKSGHKDIVYLINNFLDIKNFHYYIAVIIILFDLIMIMLKR